MLIFFLQEIWIITPLPGKRQSFVYREYAVQIIDDA